MICVFRMSAWLMKKKEVEEYSKVRVFFPPTKECYAPKCWKTVTKVIR